MATTKEDLLIEIKANTTQATAGFKNVVASLGNLERQLQIVAESQRKSSKSLNDFGLSAAKIAASFYVAEKAVSFLIEGMKKTVGEFFKSEDATRRLANALKLMGEQNIEGSLQRFRKLGEQLQRTTTIEDDHVVSLAALGVAAGRSDAEIEKLIKTSVDFAAATGTDVDSAMQTLLATFKGQTRALETYAPKLKNLTQQQILSGQAVDIISKKFAGFGVAMGTTFSGGIERAKNVVGDIMETLGRIINSAFRLDDGATSMLDYLQRIEEWLSVKGAAIAGLLATIKQSFVNFFDFMTMGLGLFAASILKIIDVLSSLPNPILSFLKIPQENIQTFEKQIDDIMSAVNRLYENMKTPALAADEAIDRYRRPSLATVLPTPNGSRQLAPKVISDEAKKLLEDLANKQKELVKQSETLHKNDLEQIIYKAQLERDELKILEKKLQKEGAITAEAKKRLEISRAAIKDIEAQEKLRLEQQVNVSVAGFAKSGESARAGINQQFADMQKLLDLKREFLFMKGPPQDAAVKDLEAQQKILEKRRAAAMAATPSNEFETAKASGEVIASQISGALTGPAIGAITGAMEGAMAVVSAAQGAIDTAQQLVDALPRLLDSIANLFASLTDLPNRLAQSIGKVLDNFTAFIRNFLPNMVRMLSSVAESLIRFIENLPDTFIAMIDELDTLLTNFIEKLPSLAERLATALIEASPEISIKMMEVMYSKAPELAFRLMKVMVTRLPVAIYDGIIKGLLKVRDMLADLFKGKWPKSMTPPDIKVDGKQASKVIAQLTQDTNKLFSVNALQDAAQSAETTVAGITKAAAKAGFNMWAAFKQAMSDAWEWLKNQGKRIWDGVVEAVGQAWEFIKSWGAKIWDGLKDAVEKSWEWVKKIGNKIWEGLKSAIENAWDWIKKIGGAIWDGLKEAVGDVAKTLGAWGAAIWQGVVDAVGDVVQKFGEWGSAIWNGVTNAIGDVAQKFGEWGQAIWQGLVDMVKDPKATFAPWGQAIWDGLLQAIGDIGIKFGEWGGKIWDGFLKPIGDTFAGFGGKIVDGLKAGLNNIGTIFNSLFQNIGNTFKNIFKLDAKGAIDGIQKAFEDGAGALKDAFKAVINPVVDVFNGIIDVLNDLKLPKATVNIPGWGKQTLWDEIDIIPGDIGRIAKFAQGGIVTGPGGTDNVPAWLTAGEFVINRQAVRDIGLPTLQSLNTGRGVAGNTTQNITLNLKIESKERLDENFVKQRLMPAIREELRRGSLDGRAVVYAGGVRT